MSKPEVDTSDIENYLERIIPRLSEMENLSNAVTTSIRNRDWEMTNTRDSLRAEIQQLKLDIKNCQIVMTKQKEVLRNLSQEFKGLAKLELLDRLKDKVDDWNPETFITKDELRKKLNSMNEL